MLEGDGFEIVDLGIDVSADQFISVVRTDGAQIIAMSALLTTTMPMMKTMIDELKTTGPSSTCQSDNQPFTQEENHKATHSSGIQWSP